MTAWNDTFGADLDWSQVAFLNMLRSAMLERGAAQISTPTIPAAVSAGDDVAGALGASGLPVVPRWQDGIGEILGILDTIYAEQYTDPGATYDGVGSFPGTFDFTTLRTACGFATTTKYRRKRPREIADTSAGSDTQGNTAANGQRAWQVASPYGIWQRVAGVWTASNTSAGPPDILDTDAAAPNNCVPTSNTYGMIDPGDYLGPWLFAEIRDSCNKLIWTQQTGGDQDTSGFFKTGTGTGATWAAAKTAAETAYDAYTPAADSSLSRSIGEGSYDGTTYTATLTRGGNGVGPKNNPGGVARTIEWYLRASAPTGHGSDVFDAGADGVIQSTWHKYNTLATSTTVDPKYGFPANLTTRPPWPAATPTVGSSKGAGWQVATFFDIKLLLKWDVAGGFAYTLAT